MNLTGGGYGPELESHRKILWQLANKVSGEFVNCSSPEKAALMIERIFKCAKDRVYVFSDHLNTDVWGHCDVIDAADEFLRKEDSQLIIIVQLNHKEKNILVNNIFLRQLKNFKNKIAVYEAKDNLKRDLHYHFIVANTHGKTNPFMYEYDFIDHLTTGSFNREEISQKLLRFFEKSLDSTQVEKIVNIFEEIDDVFRGRKKGK